MAKQRPKTGGPLKANAPGVVTPAAATAAVYNAAAVAGFKNTMEGIAWSYSAAPTGGRLSVECPVGDLVLDPGTSPSLSRPTPTKPSGSPWRAGPVPWLAS